MVVTREAWRATKWNGEDVGGVRKRADSLQAQRIEATFADPRIVSVVGMVGDFVYVTLTGDRARIFRKRDGGGSDDA